MDTAIAAGPLALVTGYQGDEVKSKCAKIMNLSSLNGVSVVDTLDTLAMLHYDDDSDKKAVGDIRGTLVETDPKYEGVVVDSFGYTPVAVTNALTVVDGIITIQDTEKNVHKFTVNDSLVLRPVFDGVLLRKLRYNGKNLTLTHRRIRTDRSRWGSNKYFVKMYEEGGGPTDEQLFDMSKPFSAVCYDFLVVDPALMVGSRQMVTCPYVVFLGERPVISRRAAEEIAPGKFVNPTSTKLLGRVTEPCVYQPPLMTVEQANKHLKFGYYREYTAEDPRQLTGEAVILYQLTDGVITDIVRVHSLSYDWRLNLRGNNANIKHQFYSLLTKVYHDVDSDEAWQRLAKQFIMFPLYNESEIKEMFAQHGKILVLPAGEITHEMYTTRDARIQLLWMNYLFSLPPNYQAQAINFMDDYRRERRELADWLIDLESKHEDFTNMEIHNRVKSLITSAREIARSTARAGNNYSTNGAVMTIHDMIKNIINNFIRKERGDSLYALVREMKKSKEVVALPATAAPVLDTDV